MRWSLIALALAGFMVAVSAASADAPITDDEPPVVSADEAEVYIEALGTRIAVDEDRGIVDIQAPGVRIYVEESGRVDIRAPGVKIQTDSR